MTEETKELAFFLAFNGMMIFYYVNTKDSL